MLNWGTHISEVNNGVNVDFHQYNVSLLISSSTSSRNFLTGFSDIPVRIVDDTDWLYISLGGEWEKEKQNSFPLYSWMILIWFSVTSLASSIV